MTSLRPFARLVRLPNLPSALADICLAALALRALPDHWVAFVLILPASACLYCAGMALNDLFDREQDRRERPDRPLPSGQVSVRQAAWLGAGLLTAGVMLATLAGLVEVWRGEMIRPTLPIVYAALLVGAIVLYDAWLKRTWAGPIGMGTCRFFNVLLGASIVWPSAGGWLPLHLALVVGLYIVGVTWFARTEARASRRSHLLGAASVMLAALVLAVALPVHVKEGTASLLFLPLLVVLGFALALPIQRACAAPTPSRVQAAVKRSLFCLIALDAISASAVAGDVGLAILVLLAPSLYLNRRSWLYAT